MSDCKCESCKGACANKPGWFLPGEAEKLADHLGVSFEEVFNTKLSVDWYEGGTSFDHDVYVLSPNVLGGRPGEEFGANPRGICVFFVNGECSIHAVKPFECKELYHTDELLEIKNRHRFVAEQWDNETSRGQIETLLGREPQPSAYFGGAFSMILDSLRDPN